MNDLTKSARTIRNARSCKRPRTILITGSNSGIGLCAAKILRLSNPSDRLILVARSEEKARMAKASVEAVLPKNSYFEAGNVIAMACDQSSFESVRQFASKLRKTLSQLDSPEEDATGIDAMCLNAATLGPDLAEPEFTKDGLERTFQVNFLGPFLMVNLTHDLMNPSGRFVLTTSGLHHRASFNNFEGMIDPSSRMARKGFKMIDGSEYHHKRSYSASKLCVAAFCLALNRRIETQRSLVANCFTPGLITSSGLFRNHPLSPDAIALKHDGKDDTLEWGGGTLAWMATADAAGKRGGEFWQAPMGASHTGATFGNEFCPSHASTNATDPQLRSLLWDLSCQLTGVPTDAI